MKKLSLLNQEPKPNRFFEGNFFAIYINAVIGGLIMLGVILILVYFLRLLFHISPITSFIISFIFSIFVNIFFAKQLMKLKKIGYYIQNKYVDFLNKFWEKKQNEQKN
jgi:membrane protein YdbS with pleckstrin-like domain